ncbi:MAG: Mini-ribonuclease 3 [Clostridiaceae bacterium]|jgi:ribonuclease-3 family protein|nr:Mini-ribonuclease 3 [Clostridiaceae bacterium]
MTENLFKNILETIDFGGRDIREYSPLVLAYLGDAVYEVFIRTYVVANNNVPVYRLHKYSTNYVKAKAQSDIIHRIVDLLTDEEKDIVRRGRNTKSATIPKNADVTEYKYATGLESLLGYIYLKKDYKRLMELLKMCVGQEYTLE